ncbi:MAG: ribonuclease H-like domain-containing protein [bacterium]|nr:ribonuclease H-like domain-containing protein [bacterium]MDP2704311.1 ribonuclease H-like domain-containing protein [bacterium]
MDKLVFDIETKNTFEDVGGRDNFHALQVSLVCAYSYDTDEYMTFEEDDLQKFGELARHAMLIGFNSKGFDVPVLEKHYHFALSSVPHYDILEEIDTRLGKRISLDLLAKANLGENRGKIGHGLDAIRFYREGDMESLRKYCLQDVKVTKEIFDLIRSQGYLWVPQRQTPEMAKVELPFEEPKEEQGRLL